MFFFEWSSSSLQSVFVALFRSSSSSSSDDDDDDDDDDDARENTKIYTHSIY